MMSWQLKVLVVVSTHISRNYPKINLGPPFRCTVVTDLLLFIHCLKVHMRLYSNILFKIILLQLIFTQMKSITLHVYLFIWYQFGLLPNYTWPYVMIFDTVYVARMTITHLQIIPMCDKIRGLNFNRNSIHAIF